MTGEQAAASRPGPAWWLIAGIIIAALFALQWRLEVAGPWGSDGSYYLQIARHVAEGDGLVTSVCLYDQGLRTLPAPTNAYPLLPLLLGLTSHVVPLQIAATVLPRMFFAIDLFLLFALASRVGGTYVGIAAVFLLGLNPSFFAWTCYPYSEGLAFFFALSALLFFHRATERGAALHYALCGVLAGLAFLTRSQMLFLAIAIGAVLLGAALRRNVRWTAVAVFAAGFLITILPWVIYLTTFVRPFQLSALIGTYSETPALPMFDQQVPTSGPLAYFADRLHGVLVMFNPLSDFSFVSSFGFAALLVPIAAVYVLVKRRWHGGLTALATAAAGLLMCAVLLSSHNRFFLEWLFSYRHGLPFIFLLVAAIAQLTGRYARATALVLVVISALMNVPRVVALTRQPRAEWPSVAEKQLAFWLAKHDPHAIILSTEAQDLAVATRANFRWAACQQSPREILRVLELVRTDYVLVYEQEQACPFAHGLDAKVIPVTSFGDAPNRIMLLKVRR
jgi:4-amino-4-deoxy-L-arabinose transferase-like glycosyltransferase